MQQAARNTIFFHCRYMQVLIMPRSPIIMGASIIPMGRYQTGRQCQLPPANLFLPFLLSFHSNTGHCKKFPAAVPLPERPFPARSEGAERFPWYRWNNKKKGVPWTPASETIRLIPGLSGKIFSLKDCIPRKPAPQKIPAQWYGP